MLAVLLIAVLALQVWVWNSLVTRVRSGRLSPARAVLRYTGAALLPVVGLAIVFFTLVGLEEWLGIAVLSEPFSRATPLLALLLIGLFVIGSLGFALWCTYLAMSQHEDRES